MTWLPCARPTALRSDTPTRTERRMCRYGRTVGGSVMALAFVPCARAGVKEGSEISRYQKVAATQRAVRTTPSLDSHQACGVVALG